MVFITVCLTIFVFAFLIMIAVKAIRVERHVLDMVELVESRVTRLYSQNE